MDFSEMSVRSFSERLASKAPVPGGGGASALVGALGIALGDMVGALTVGKKTTQITGYQIQYSTDKAFKSYKTKTVSSYKTTSTTLTGLSAKKTYYVRIRTYKTVNGVKYYSGWSTVKYLKTK